MTTVTPKHTLGVPTPEHPLHALATFELADYRRKLEHAISSCEQHRPAEPALAGLRDALAKVTAEQDDRARIATRNA
ncbi:MAG: hypothetical protein ACRDPY_03190 [Streptosporangiaceae bacterium]